MKTNKLRLSHLLFMITLLFSGIICAQPKLNWVQKIEASGSGSSVYETWTYYMVPGPPLKADSRGNLVVAGTLMGVTTNLQGIGTPFTINPIYSNDCYLASYKDDGSIDWGFTIGSAQFDAPMGITIDKDDNIYLWGFFEAAITLDPGVGSVVLTPADGNRDIFIAKYSKNGNLLNHMQLVYNWTGVMTEYIYGIEIDSDGDVMVAGNYGQNIDLDPTATVYSMPNLSNTSKSFVARYDSTFQFEQVFTMKSVSTFAIAMLDFKLAKDDGFFIGGEFADTVDFDMGPGVYKEYSPGNCGYVARYDSLGNLVWMNRVRNDWHSQVSRIAVTDDDKVIVAGKFTAETTTFYMASGDTTVFSDFTGSYWDWDLFLAEFNESGQTVWAKHLPQTEYHTVFNSLDFQSEDRTLFAAFSFTGQVNMDYGNTNFTLSGPIAPTYTMGLGLIYEVDGNFQEAYQLNSAGINYNFIDARDGSLYMFGLYRNTLDVDFRPTVSNVTTTNNPGVFLAKYCRKPQNVSTDATDTIYACQGEPVIVTASGAGHYDWYDAPVGGTLISSDDTLQLTAMVSMPIYAEGAIGECDSRSEGFYLSVSICTGIEEHTNAQQLYPLSTFINDQIIIAGDSKEALAFMLYSADGRLVRTGMARNHSSIEAENLSKGMYVLRLGDKTFKLIKQ